MKTIYDPNLKAHLSMDEEERVREILHTQEYFLSDKSNARLAALDYLHKMAETFQIPEDQLRNAHQPASFLDPRVQDIQYRFYEVKKFFSSSTYSFYQTIHNTPVWQSGLTVTVQENPYRIIHADHYGHRDLSVNLPSVRTIEQIRAVLIQINSSARSPQMIRAEERQSTKSAALNLRNVFPSLKTKAATSRTKAEVPSWFEQIQITRGFFYIYRFDAKNRQPEQEHPVGKGATGAYPPETSDAFPTLPLPAVARQIKNGQHYLVVEIVFHLPVKPSLNWKALVETETGAILWLRPMTSGVHGLVFTYDPKTSTGDLTITGDSTNAVLNLLRDDVVLPNLNMPTAGNQSLSGTHVTVVDDDLPVVAPPTEHSGTDFDYDARTNNFAAVNAYYHANNVFDTIEDLGFALTGPGGYFDTTSFPIHVDHRASISSTDGIEINAYCNGDGPGGLTGDGIGLVGFCLSDDTGVADTTIDPLGRAVDKWVHWHEIGGHGILWDHINNANFQFAHSAGDSLAAFQNDPESQLRALPQRFQYAPFRSWPAGSDRWFNRTVATGWGWGGTQDTGGYQSEQVLATTLFRLYQSLGGEATDVAKRWHASRVATYLVLNAVGHCSVVNNPADAAAFHNRLVVADGDDWTTEGLFGGAYNKVIRWAFEKQGLWRAAGAPTTNVGEPPAVDVYIDDGRAGEYQYQAVHWQNQSMWNQNNPADPPNHVNAIDGQTNYMYGKFKNRGTSTANNVTVRAYHSLPGAGLTWPNDFVEMNPIGGLPIASIAPNNTAEVTVGPFEWEPNINAYGHDCVLMIASVAGDVSNVDNFTPTQTIAEWRLVPHDNNVGQRNVTIAPGGGGGEALAAALNGAFFMAGNNLNRRAAMELRVEMPEVLATKGWQLQFDGLADNKFTLNAGEKRRIQLKLRRGTEFTKADVESTANRMINVSLLGNGIVLGGMSYYVDPELRAPSGGKRPTGRNCDDAAQELLNCLKISNNQKVKKVCVKKVSLDIELDNDCDCK